MLGLGYILQRIVMILCTINISLLMLASIGKLMSLDVIGTFVVYAYKLLMILIISVPISIAYVLVGSIITYVIDDQLYKRWLRTNRMVIESLIDFDNHPGHNINTSEVEITAVEYTPPHTDKY